MVSCAESFAAPLRASILKGALGLAAFAKATVFESGAAISDNHLPPLPAESAPATFAGGGGGGGGALWRGGAFSPMTGNSRPVLRYVGFCAGCLILCLFSGLEIHKLNQLDSTFFIQEHTNP